MWHYKTTKDPVRDTLTHYKTLWDLACDTRRHFETLPMTPPYCKTRQALYQHHTKRLQYHQLDLEIMTSNWDRDIIHIKHERETRDRLLYLTSRNDISNMRHKAEIDFFFHTIVNLQVRRGNKRWAYLYQTETDFKQRHRHKSNISNRDSLQTKT